jgi:serine/threonine protein kinase/tetratricopeptide (TPR) repeat protein
MELLLRWEDAREAGQPMTAEELCDDCPEMVPEVKRRIADLQGMVPVVAGTGDPEVSTVPGQTAGQGAVSTPPGVPPGKRYRPVRFHAKGALGEVHVAFDEELHREVALKRMQGQYARDADSRRRFVLEAEITGRLEHPGVVPVHGLIQNSDNEPCYAMRFIQGDTLKEAIERFHEADKVGRDAGERSLELRQLLSRFVAVCNTVAYAHSRGILHRDIKPGNIMLGKYGETLVVDWGLAKSFERDETTRRDGEETLRPASLSSPTETQFGQAVGTPAYMSPEQAQGRWDLVGPASDIYSLGATLYTLLTGQTPDACVPRQVHPRMPPALDAICRKSMAPRREERYATALALAADVEHWLAGEPVSAYREPWTVKMRRWTSGHRVHVTAAAAAMLVLIVGGFAVALWYVNDQAYRRAQLDARQKQVNSEASAALDEAEKLLLDLRSRLDDPGKVHVLLSGIDEWKGIMEGARQGVRRARAVAAGQEDLLEAGVAARLQMLADKFGQEEQAFALAKDLDEIRLDDSTLVDRNVAFPGRAATRYSKFFATTGLDVEQGDLTEASLLIVRSPARWALVAGLDHWADVTQDNKLRQRLLQLARQADPHPWRDRFRDVKVWNDLKELEQLGKDLRPEEQSPQVIVALGSRLRANGGDAAGVLRRALLHHGRDFWLFFRLSRYSKDPVERIGCFQAALALRPHSSAAHNNLGLDLSAKNDLEGAIHAFEKAIQLNPNNAAAHYNLGLELRAKKELERAITAYRKAIQVDPNFALAHNNLGTALRANKDLDGAITAFRKAIVLDPNIPHPHYNLGNALVQKKDLDGAIIAYRNAIRLEPGLAGAHSALGNALLQRGQFADARQAIHEALNLFGTNDVGRRLAEQRLKRCDRFLDLDQKLAAFLDRGEAPVRIEDWLALADLCRRPKQYHASAVRLYAALFATRPPMADDVAQGHRYHASRSALLAAAGKGLDPKEPDVSEKTRFRSHALDWLRADLDLFAKQFRAAHAESIVFLLDRLPGWDKDEALASVRGPEALRGLPRPEQEAWQRLWSDRDQLLQQVRASVTETHFEGTLTAKERAHAHEWKATANRTYVIDLHSTAFDAYLKLMDGNGKLLAEHDDIAPDNKDARLIFTPKEDGTFRIVATSFEEQGSGAYILTIRALAGKSK